MQKQFPDRQEVRCTKKDKTAWRRAAKHEGAKDLSDWIRQTLNEAASLLGF